MINTCPEAKAAAVRAHIAPQLMSLSMKWVVNVESGHEMGVKCLT